VIVKITSELYNWTQFCIYTQAYIRKLTIALYLTDLIFKMVISLLQFIHLNISKHISQSCKISVFIWSCMLIVIKFFSEKWFNLIWNVIPDQIIFLFIKSLLNFSQFHTTKSWIQFFSTDSFAQMNEECFFFEILIDQF